MFEALQQIKIANNERLRKAPGKKFTGSSYDDNELKANLKGLNLQEGATAKDRNEQIGGHKA